MFLDCGIDVSRLNWWMISTIVSCRRREEKKMKKNKRIELVYWN
jgi:hypothetical protein